MTTTFGTPTPKRRWLLTAAAILSLLALLAAGCGGDDDATDDPPEEPTSEAETETPEAETPEPEPDPTEAEAPAEEEPAAEEPASDDAEEAAQEEPAAEVDPACTQQTAGGPGTYIVVDIPANDPDGGLVAHSAPGVDAPEEGVFPPDYGVFFDGSLDSCAITPDGGVWWNVTDADFSTWVNASYLSMYMGPGDREAIGTAEALCEPYQFVVDAQETDIPITAQLIAMDVELGGHPAGVGAAISDLINGTGDYTEAYNTIAGYVGPICTG